MSEVRPTDVIIDNKGYLVREGSYRVAKRPVAADQFRTGDVSYENLSDQQAWAQSDWRGGASFDKYQSNTNFSASEGLRVLSFDGSLRLEGSLSTLSNTHPDTVLTGGIKTSYEDNWFVAENSILYYRNQNSATWVSAANLSTVYINDMENFAGKMYVSGNDIQVLWASTAPTSGAGWSAELSASAGVRFNKLVAFGDKMYISESGNSTNNKLTAYDGTGSTGLKTVIQSNQWDILNMVEYNGRLYMGCQAISDTKRFALRVYDGTTDWTVQEWEHVANPVGGTFANIKRYTFRVMIVFNGKLYFNIQNYKFFHQMMTFDGQNIESVLEVGPKQDLTTFSDTGSGANQSIKDAIVINGYLYIIIGYTRSGGITSEYSVWCTEGNYWFKPYYNTFLNSDSEYTLTSYGSISLLYILRGNGQDYLQGTSFSSSGDIDSGVIDMDLFSIGKKVSSVELYHSALPASAYVKLNLYSYSKTASLDKTASIVNSTVGSRVTVLKPEGNGVGSTFKYNILLSGYGDETSTPVVTDLVMRYVLEPTYKKIWSFDVLVQDNLELRDGTREPRSAVDLRKDLEEAASKAIVSFVDADGSNYEPGAADEDNRGVVVKDIQFLGPYNFAGDGPEYIASITLTEA